MTGCNHSYPSCSGCEPKPMTLDDYQRETDRTRGVTHDPRWQLATFGLGVAGEAGEVADLLKKHLGHGHPLDYEKLTKELGDVLWYVSAIASEIGCTLQWVAEANIEKLKKRYPNGFERERSLNRAPEDK